MLTSRYFGWGCRYPAYHTHVQGHEPLFGKCIDRFLQPAKTTAGASGKDQGAYKEISLADAAMVMSYANKVMVVPVMAWR